MFFHQINVNPKQNKVGDCVIRAIAYATDQTWERVFDDLCAIARKKCRMPNDDKVYAEYLKKLGWEQMKQPRKQDNTKFTVQEFVDEYVYDCEDSNRNNARHICRVAHHLTCVSYAELYDTWNCGHKTVGKWWRKV